MAGHSKFKNIMHRKGAQDKKRASLFARLGKEIIVAAKMGGADPDANSRLRLAIQNAKSQSMPKDNIERAIKRGAGGNEDDNFEEIRYEGYAPGGVAVIVDCLTNNRNRSASDVRAIFSKAGGALGETGSVSFMFDRAGEVKLPKNVGDYDDVFEAAVEAGAHDVEETDEAYEVFCDSDDLNMVSSHLEADLCAKKSLELLSANLIWRPKNFIAIDDVDKAKSLLKFMDALDDNDDVQDVTANFDIPDNIMENIE